MLQSLIEWLTGYLAQALDAVISAFLKALSPSLEAFIGTFPGFADAYSVFQVMGYGFTVVIAALGFYQYFFAEGADSREWTEQPWQILLRVAVCGAMIVGGGYILSYLVTLAKFSYNVFLGLDYTTEGGSSYLEYAGEYVSTTFSDNMSGTSLAASVATLGTNLVIEDGAIALLVLVLDIVIGWELLKLMVEVTERYLIVGVLVYSAPLVFSTVASAQTVQIFKRWCGMFISSLLMMSMSVFFLNLCVSALQNLEPGDNFFISLLMILAMVKIGQRIDSYMGQLGLNTAHTGGALLDDAVAGLTGLSRMAGMVAGRSHGGRNGDALGKAGSAALGLLGRGIKNGPVGVAARGIWSGVKSGAQTAVSGGTLKDSVTAAGAAARDTLRTGTLGAAAVSVAENMKNPGKSAGQVVKEALGAGAKAGIDNVADTYTGHRPFEDQASAKSQVGDVERERLQNLQNPMQTGHADLSEKQINAVEKGKLTSEQAAKNLRYSGIQNADGEIMQVDKDGNAQFSTNASAAGLKLEQTGSGKQYAAGSSDAVQKFMSDEINGKDAGTQNGGKNVSSYGDLNASERESLARQAKDNGNADLSAAALRYEENLDSDDRQMQVSDTNSSYYAAAQEQMKADTTRSFGPDHTMTYEEATHAAADPAAVEKGGSYYTAANEAFFRAGELHTDDEIRASAQKLQESDREELHSSTVAAAQALQIHDSEVLNPVAQAYAVSSAETAKNSINSIALETARRTDPQIARNLLATEDFSRMSDAMSSALATNAYAANLTDIAPGTVLTNVTCGSGNGEYGSGRSISADYVDTQGQKQRVTIYDSVCHMNGVVAQNAAAQNYRISKPYGDDAVVTMYIESTSGNVQAVNRGNAYAPDNTGKAAGSGHRGKQSRRDNPTRTPPKGKKNR